MNFKGLKKLLFPQEEIGGIEIDDTGISGIYLKEKAGKKNIIRKAKISFSQEVIKDAEVKNKEIFIACLNDLIKKLFKKRIKKILPVVISIPSQRVFSQLFDFPDRMTYEGLEEAMQLTVGFSLPIPLKDSYVDWEIVNDPEKKIYLSLVKKEIIDGFINSFEEAVFLPIACETHLESLNRALSTNEQEPYCFVLVDKEGVEIGISKERDIRFDNNIFWKKYSEKELGLEEKKKILKEEILRTINFFQTDLKDNAVISKIYLIGDLKELSEFEQYLKKETKLEIIIPSPSSSFEMVSTMEGKEEVKKQGKLAKIESDLAKTKGGLEQIKKELGRIVGKEIEVEKNIKTLKDKEKAEKSKNEKKKIREEIFAVEEKRQKLEKERYKIELQKKRTESEANKLELSIPKKEEPKEPAVPAQPEKKEDNRTLISIGAALRGFIPREKDNLISLLPEGTEERYFQSKFVNLFNFLFNFFLVLSIILVSLFGGIYLLFFRISGNIETQLKNLEAVPESVQLKEIKTRVNEFNKNINFINEIQKEISPWSVLFNELKSQKPEGVVLTKIEALSFKSPVVLEGVAKTRDELLKFKENLTNSTKLIDVQLPLKFLEEKENINFTITLKTK